MRPRRRQLVRSSLETTLMYLLYPNPNNDEYVFWEVPPGKTPAQLAESYGLTMAECAAFDMADFDAGSSNFNSSFVLVNNQPLPNSASFNLPSAKNQAAAITKSNSNTYQQAALNNFSPETLAAQATLSEVARIPAVQEAITEVNALAVQLEAELAAIAAATSVTEVSNIAYPPTGIINIGRGQFGGPFDLNASNYVTFNSSSMTESQTELYAPATATIVPYQGFPPDDFNSSGAIFTLGNYLIQIRETATSRVIAEFEVPLSSDGTNEDVVFNGNP